MGERELQALKKQEARIALMAAALVAIFFASMCIGRYDITPLKVLRHFQAAWTGSLQGLDEIEHHIIMQVRLPRTLLSILVGAGLSCSGVSFQCIFGNPLVSPDILGVSAGAGFGAALSILLHGNDFMVQMAALFFGLAAVLIVLLLSGAGGKMQLHVLVLSGVIVGAFFSALISFAKYVADPQDELPAITMWLMGSLASSSYRKVLICAAVILPCILVFIALRWKLNLLSLDEEEAQSLGVDVVKLRLIIVMISTLMTAVSVSFCGIIGWIGLVIPHIGRFMVGNDHRALVPASVFLGGSYLLIIDNVARSLTAAELPLSILTAMIGAPFFAAMLRKNMSEGGY